MYAQSTLLSNPHPNHRDAVLTKALNNLVSAYELKGKDIAQILGISEASATRLSNGKRLIAEHSKEGELAVLLIRLYSSLNALVGNDPIKAKAWLNSPNQYFAGTPPMEHIKRLEGLAEVVHYLDAMRGKI